MRQTKEQNRSAERGTSLIELMFAMVDRAVRIAALDSLARKQSPLRRSSNIWSLIKNGQTDPCEQAKALLCLERTRSFSASEIRDEVFSMRRTLPRFFAARCLITVGDKSGVAVLLDLLEGEETTDGSVAQQAALLSAARELLGELSGTGPNGGIAEWRNWLRTVKSLLPQDLPEPETGLVE